MLAAFTWLPPHTQRVLSAVEILPPTPIATIMMGAVVAVICFGVVVAIMDVL